MQNIYVYNEEKYLFGPAECAQCMNVVSLSSIKDRIRICNTIEWAFDECLQEVRDEKKNKQQI